MKVPDPVPYGLARSGRGRVRHIQDWRGIHRQFLGLCDQPLGGTLTADELALDIYRQMPVCSTCQDKLQKMRDHKIITGTESIYIEGKTLPQVIELALKAQVPPEATIVIDGQYQDYPEIVLRWNITE